MSALLTLFYKGVSLIESGSILGEHSRTNSYGVPMERVTVIEGTLSTSEAQFLLGELEGENLPNILEGLDAQVNATQRRKLTSPAARKKSEEHGYSFGEHNQAASQIANIWKWAAQAIHTRDKNEMSDISIRRFVSSLLINNNDVFAWITVKDTTYGLKLYSVELLNEKQLRVTLNSEIKDSDYSHRSYEEILDRLKGPVNEEMASVGKGRTNSYGVPMERVTVIEEGFTREKAEEALKELAGKDLPNLLEGLSAQVNSRQRGKLVSNKARDKSINNGFTGKQHYGLAKQLENVWKWSVEAAIPGRKEDASNVIFWRFISSVKIGGEDEFVLVSVKDTSGSLKIYSVELANENQIKEKLLRVEGHRSGIDSHSYSARSIKEILDRLKGPVNEEMASVGKGRTNSYGVPMERVTVIEEGFTREEAEEALKELAGKDLPNLLEGITAQINTNQRNKILNHDTVKKSYNNDFAYGEHDYLAGHLANAWKWAADAKVGGRKEELDSPDMELKRFVAPINIRGKDAFVWISVKNSSQGSRIYSMEMVNEQQLRTKLLNKKMPKAQGGSEIASSKPYHSLGIEKILGRLKGPVNEEMASVGKGRTNSYGVPMERVTVLDKPFTREEAKEALKKLAKKELPNLLEGITAQVNRNQRDKLTSGKAVDKSVDNGFAHSQHHNLAAKIADVWKWAAEVGWEKNRDNAAPEIVYLRFAAPVKIKNIDYFAWITVEDTITDGLRLYSVELLNEKKLRLLAGAYGKQSQYHPVRSYEEILDRLKGPVNEEKPLASLNLRDILNMKSRQAANIANDPVIRRAMPKDDLSLFQRITQLPHWIAKPFPKFAAIYERQLRRQDDVQSPKGNPPQMRVICLPAYRVSGF